MSQERSNSEPDYNSARDSFSPGEFSPNKAGFKVELYRRIESTNTAVVERGRGMLPLLNPDGSLTARGAQYNRTLIAAESQSAGRGRAGRVFISPDATGVYFSFALVRRGVSDNPALLTLVSAVGVCRAVERAYEIPCRIKWLNDIFCRGKKVCGILCEGIVNPETQKIEGCVVGIGVNLTASSLFGGELSEKAGGILDARSFHENRVPRLGLVSLIADEICGIIDGGENILPEYRSRSLLTGQRVTVSSLSGTFPDFTARVLDVEDDGALLVELSDGTKSRLYSEEVTLHMG